MSESFTKLFSSILTSTVWREDSDTKVVWVTMLALADQHGEVAGSVPGLAHMANVSIEACQSALAKFMAPDRWSRTKDDDGRRIIEIDGGWHLLNYKKYRKLQSKADQIAAASARTQRYRERKRANVDIHAMSTPVHAIPTEAEAEAEAEAERKNPPPPSGGVPPARKAGTRIPPNWRPDDAGRSFAGDRGLDPDSTADAFADYWTAATGRTATKLDWNAAFRTWCRRDATGSMGQSANRPVQPSTGRGAFFEQLAIIASRDDPDDDHH